MVLVKSNVEYNFYVSLLVLPSLGEGLPLSILEAMSHGLPTVATDVGGIPELVTEGQEGLLVPPKDTEALAAAIARIAADPQLRTALGSNARRRVEAEFSFDTMLRQYAAVYRSLLRQPQP